MVSIVPVEGRGHTIRRTASGRQRAPALRNTEPGSANRLWLGILRPGMPSRTSTTPLPTFRVPLAVLLGAIACWFVFNWTQPAGPGLDPDAVQYVAAAKSLAANGTLEVPDDSWDSP